MKTNMPIELTTEFLNVLQSAKKLANATGKSHLIFVSGGRYNYTDTPRSNWLPLEQAFCLVKPAPNKECYDRQEDFNKHYNAAGYAPKLVCVAD